MKSKKLVLLLVGLFFIAAAAVPLFSQTAGTGAIVGTITDSSGAVIPGATVEATNTDTGQVRTVTSGADGSYRFALLPPGAYKVKFSSNGFKTVEVPRITVAVTEIPTLDQKLELGAQTEQVTVEANAEVLQTASAALGGTVTGSTVTELPLTSRNYTNIMALSAGISAGVTNASALGTAGMDMSVNGAPTSTNSTSIDGQNVQNPGEQSGQTAGFGNGGYNPVPSPDAIQEFKVQTATYDAGYGRGIGANVNVITKSGTNTLHGSAFEFFRNTVLNANDFFLNQAGKGKGVLNQNQFGGVLGGPIRKDKLFFFGSYQGTRQKNGLSRGSSNFTLPPIPAGDRSNTAAFTAALGALNCPANNPGAAYQTVRGGVQVACDGTNINPVAALVLQTKFPAGSQKGQYLVPGSGSNAFTNTIYSTPATFKEDQYMFNLDDIMSSKNTLSFRFFFSNAPAFIPFPSGTSVPGFGAPYKYRNYADLLKLTTVITPNLVNEARVSFHRAESGADLDESGLTFQNFGITPLSPSIGAMGIFNITGVGLIGSGGAAGSQYGPDRADGYQAAEQISWTHGKHTIRAGGELSKYRWNWDLIGLGVGNINFGTFADFLIGRAGCPPASTTCSTTNPGATNGTLFSNIASTNTADAMGTSLDAHMYRQEYEYAFITDDFKVSQRLTLNLGVRWEYDGALWDAHGVLTNVWPSALNKPGWEIPPSAACVPQCSYAGWVEPSNYPTVGGVYGVLLENLPGMTRAPNKNSLQKEPSKHQFAPRFGFAWQPTGGNKLVVRGGFGMFYDLVPGESYIFGINNAPPLANAIGKGGTSNFFSTEAVPFLQNQLGQFQSRWANFSTLETSAIAQQIFPSVAQTPISLSWSLNTQYNFLPSWVLELGYVGSHSYHVNNSGGVNDIDAIADIGSPAHPIWGITTNTVANAIVRVPYLGFNSMRVQCTCFDSKFNSFQATLRKQLSHGVRFETAYTWARSFTNSNITQNASKLQDNWGLNTNVHPHRLVINYSWEIWAGHSKGLAGKLFGGWNLSGVTTIQNGTPLTITDSRGGTIFGNFTNAGGLARAQLAPGKTYADIPTPGDLKSRLGGSTGGCGYFASYQSTKTLNGVSCTSLSAFTGIPNYVTPDGIVTNGSGWGNSGPAILLGPGQFNFDAALIKNTRIGGIREDANLQFRAEFFNLMNHAQFSNPTVGISSATNFGQITSTTVNPRLIQFALKYSF